MIDTAWSSLVGKWLHTFTDEGFVDRQGRIIGMPIEGYVFVQWYSWVMGDANGVTLVPISEAAAGKRKWEFYQTDEEMREAYEYFLPRHRVTV